MRTGFRQRTHLTSKCGPIALAFFLGTCAPGWSVTDATCPDPVATCTLPAATRLPESIATYFHTGGVVTFAVPTESNCAEPIATCIQPAPSVAQLPGTGLAWRSDHAASVSELLRSWSAASHQHPAWTTTEKNWLARRHQPWLSAVALDAVVKLASTVTEADLADDFTWTQEAVREDVTVLRAVPTDETQRLFCPQLRVELDATTHALAAIDVADRAGTWRPIDLPWAVLPKPTFNNNTIVLTADAIEIAVANADGTALPPSPTTPTLLRVAAERVEFDVSSPR